MVDALFGWLLLPLGMALGWVLGRRAPPSASGTALDKEQLGGLLTGLASDDPDQAIAALTQVAELDHSTADLHLTLGNLFRKRGEVDRALRVHEALLARPGLKPELRAQVQFELAQDYMRAGVMNRAEQLFEDLVSHGLHVTRALDQIRTIFEQGRDWLPAIEAARRLEAAKGESQRAVIAQYWCELADEARRAKQIAEALKHARRALDEDSHCVRAMLLLGALHQQDEDYAAAAKSYLRAFEQDTRFLPDVIEPLGQCFQKTGDADGYLRFLRDAKEISSSSLPYMAEARLLVVEGMDPLDHLAKGLQARPSRALLAEFLEVLEKQPNVVASGLDKPAASLRVALRKLMESTPRYQCTSCGFSPRQMFWQCPQCRHWGTTAPVDDVLKA
ncbi:MAG TPA: tetratricopeptide repeat protein [Solimonas sp.]|nr:tetratricopeptide repeat protein [Solimonas sp.]